jgi:hypothetical protein
LEEALIAVALALAAGLIGSATIYLALRSRMDTPDDRDLFGDT